MAGSPLAVQAADGESTPRTRRATPNRTAGASEKSPDQVKDRQQQRWKLRIISKRCLNEFRRAP